MFAEEYVERAGGGLISREAGGCAQLHQLAETAWDGHCR
jgi:hypothetical protein